MANTRNSLQKKAIQSALAVMDHPTASEVYERVRLEYPQISLGTVYRNLGAMADQGSALRLSFAGEPDRFDPNVYEHHHAVCSNCGAVFDAMEGIDPDIINKLDQAIEQSTGVKVKQRSLIFEGLCARCQ
jgi:Fur family peroxide stress response transcriptional regulator